MTEDSGEDYDSRMAMQLNEGLFYHPAGTSPEDVLRRLADGSFNPRLDNPFLPKLAEMARQMQVVTERRLNLEAQQREIPLKLADCARDAADLIAEFAELKAQMQRFEETGEIADVLTDAKQVIAEQSAEHRSKTIAAVETELEDLTNGAMAGWEVERKSSKGNYVFVTFKRLVSDFNAEPAPVPESIREAVKVAVESYRGVREFAFRIHADIRKYAHHFTPRQAAAP